MNRRLCVDPDRNCRRESIGKRLQSRRAADWDASAYLERNIIERLVGWLKESRRIFSRFEKTAKNYAGMMTIALIQRTCDCSMSEPNGLLRQCLGKTKPPNAQILLPGRRPINPNRLFEVGRRKDPVMILVCLIFYDPGPASSPVPPGWRSRTKGICPLSSRNSNLHEMILVQML
jgi:hypothetical protein